MRSVPILLAPILIASTATAVEPLRLEQAVATALASNPALQSARARADAAVSGARQARGFRLPSVDLTEAYTRTNNPAEVFALQLNQGRFDMNRFFGSDPNSPAWLDTWMTRIEVTQPVYTGGQLSARIGQAEAASRAEQAAAEHAREQVGFDTIRAFTDLAKARELMQLMREARSTTAEHVALAESFAGQGLLMQADVLRARVFLAEMDERVAQAENGSELAAAALLYEMGVDQAAAIEIAPLAPAPRVAGELGGWQVRALDDRRDLAAARARLEAGRLEERAAGSGFKPEVAVVGRYDLYDDSLLGSHGDSGSLMAVARINLFRGGADVARLEAARSTTASAERQIARFEDGIRLEVRQAWQQLTTARARRDAATAVLDAAREGLRVRELRFRQGLDTMLELLDAETALREAETRELVARYDLALETWRLHFAAGASLIDLLNITEEE